MRKFALVLAIGLLLALTSAGKSHAVAIVKQKVCSVVDASNWRDTFLAGKNWTAATCNAYRQATAGSDYQLGCITKDGFAFGPDSNTDVATPPNPNCGW
ncbi:MAG: hypothetical protein HYZ50_25100 [Deltaproteobacteria bacterium]|nr:hypothetical protein [Deltaproteobacteria bacterium]